MSNITFNMPLYFTSTTCIYIYIYTELFCIYIYIYIYTELAPKLTVTASVAQSVERWSRDPGSRIQFPAGDLGVAFFATGSSWVLKCISF